MGPHGSTISCHVDAQAIADEDDEAVRSWLIRLSNGLL